LGNPPGLGGLTGLFDRSPTTTEPPDERGVTIAEILEDPAVYEGLNVTIEGPIIDCATKNAFSVSGGETLTGGLLVIAANEFPNPETVPPEELALGDNTLVRVSGQVAMMTQEQIEQRLIGDPLRDDVIFPADN